MNGNESDPCESRCEFSQTNLYTMLQPEPNIATEIRRKTKQPQINSRNREPLQRNQQRKCFNLHTVAWRRFVAQSMSHTYRAHSRPTTERSPLWAYGFEGRGTILQIFPCLEVTVALLYRFGGRAGNGSPARKPGVVSQENSEIGETGRCDKRARLGRPVPFSFPFPFSRW